MAAEIAEFAESQEITQCREQMRAPHRTAPHRLIIHRMIIHLASSAATLYDVVAQCQHVRL